MSQTIAVVMPTFNSATTVERALASVVGQTRLPDEVIIVDNASSDNTIPLARAFASRHNVLTWRIQVLPTNIGPGAARNYGWDLAKSDLLAFLDSDDSWHPEKLQVQSEVTHRFADAVLFGHGYVALRQGEPVLATPSQNTTPSIDRFKLHHFLIRNRLSTPTVMLRRQIPERFPDDFWYGEDYALWLRIVAAHGAAVFQRRTLTFLYKQTYGESGLSADMTQMHCGELLAVQRLRRTRDIGVISCEMTKVWMRIKHVRRRVKMSRRV